MPITNNIRLPIEQVNRNRRAQAVENQRLFKEYVFYRCVKDYNAYCRQTGEETIKLSEIPAWRNRFKKQVLNWKEKNPDVILKDKSVEEVRDMSATDIIADIKIHEMLSCSKYIFKERAVKSVSLKDPAVATYFKEFADNVGIPAPVNTANSKMDVAWSDFIRKQSRLPVSPFDPTFSGEQLNRNMVVWLNHDNRFRGTDGVYSLTRNPNLVRSIIGRNNVQANRQPVQRQVVSPFVKQASAPVAPVAEQKSSSQSAFGSPIPFKVVQKQWQQATAKPVVQQAPVRPAVQQSRVETKQTSAYNFDITQQRSNIDFVPPSGLNDSEAKVAKVLHKLLPYMTQAEFKALVPKFQNNRQGNEITDVPYMDIAVGILEYLEQNGIEYSILPDRYNGQIKCQFNDG